MNKYDEGKSVKSNVPGLKGYAIIIKEGLNCGEKPDYHGEKPGYRIALEHTDRFIPIAHTIPEGMLENVSKKEIRKLKKKYPQGIPISQGRPIQHELYIR